MKITPVKRLKVALVPSWLSELVVLSPDLNYEDLLEFPKLLAEKGSILSEEQVIIYALTQDYINAFTDRAFIDLPNIVTATHNEAWLADRAAKVEKTRLTISINDSAMEKREGALTFTATGLMAKEHYTPMLIDSDTVLLIGSRSPVYPDSRAFFNALLESVGDKLDYTEFKLYDFFRQYLRVATAGGA